MKKFAIYIFLILASNSALAQQVDLTKTLPSKVEAPQKKLVAFEGYVQFTDGANQILNSSGEHIDLKYGTAIYEAIKIKVDKTLKLVTRENCVVILYGDGQFESPQAEKPWRIPTRAARFICPESSKEKFNFHGIDLVVQGETLVDNSGKIFVVTGSAMSSQPMQSRRIYQFNKGSINFDPEAQQAQAQYDFDNEYKVPREGEKLKKPKPAAPNKYRMMLGPEFGPSVLLHANGLLNHYDYSANGPRLLFTFRDTIPGLMIGLHYLEIKNKSDNNYPGGSQQGLTVSDNVKSFNLDAGYRFNFQRWWSPFVRAGVIWQRNEIRMDQNSFAFNCGSNCGFHSDRIFDYFGLSAAYGIDAFLRPSWLIGLGLYASAEIELNQTIHPTTEVNKSQQFSNNREPNEATNEHGFISNFNGLVSLGVLFEF